MNIDKRDRQQLKACFTRNAIPTEEDFAALIDGMLNQKDDGIVKLPGEPLSLEAGGVETDERPVLHLFESFSDADPAWRLSLSPRSVVSDGGTAKRGLSIEDDQSVSRFFIDRDSGHVGMGTIEPAAALHVAGAGRFDGGLTVPSGQPVRGIPVVDVQSFRFTQANGPALSKQHHVKLGLKHWEKAFSFPGPLLRCQVAVGGWNIMYGRNAPLKQFMCEPTVTVTGSTALVSLSFGWRDHTFDWDDPLAEYWVDIVVIGTMTQSV